REFDLLGRRHLVMPFDAVLDERDALALDRIGEDAARPAVARRLKRGVERGMIMTVADDDFPAEGAPAVSERFELVRVLGAAALRQGIAVDARCEMVEPAMPGPHRGLPVRALLQLTIAERHE